MTAYVVGREASGEVTDFLGVVRGWVGILWLCQGVDPEDLFCLVRLGMRGLSLWNLEMGQDPLDLLESLADAFQSRHDQLPA